MKVVREKWVREAGEPADAKGVAGALLHSPAPFVTTRAWLAFMVDTMPDAEFEVVAGAVDKRRGYGADGAR